MARNYSRTEDTPQGYAHTPSGRGLSYDKMYVGKVKDNRDVRHMGRLKVWIPELSKEESNPDGWILVSYCSPFAGATSIYPSENPNSGNENTYTATQHPYGFWAVPPDLNVSVLVQFANGDQAKGFWIGCVYDDQMNFSVPGFASDDGVTPKTEYNRKVQGLGARQDPDRPTYVPLSDGLTTQGLNTDTVRGLTSSSARRRGDFGSTTDSRSNDLLTHAYKPAKVYGFSSPQGHHFVMDDGYDNTLGSTESSYIRFRTRNGTQIIVDDAEGFIYMISKNGTTWFEMSDNGETGNIDVYSLTNISLHAQEGNINLKSGNDINIQAARNLNIDVGGETILESGTNINMTAGASVRTTSGTTNETLAGGQILETGSQIHMNSSEAPASAASTIQDINAFAPPTFTDGQWVAGERYTSGNIIPRVPQHEPWPIHTIHRDLPTENRISQDPVPGEETVPDETGRTTEENPYGTTDPVNAEFEAPQTTPEPEAGIGNLSPAESQAYLDAIGQRESSQDYTAVNSLGYAGKYQMGTAALEDAGYIKSGTYADQTGVNQTGLDDPSNWTGKNGIYSKEDYLASQTAQEDAMQTFTNKNYNSLIRNKVITSATPANETAGYLAAAHLGGVGGAIELSKGTERSDAYGSSTSEYFDVGAGSINSMI